LVYRKMEQVAPTHARVLITGETGTGKELVARAIHRLSPRSEKLLVKVNCAAIPSELIESELFGYRKGAFTGALTDRDGRFHMAHKGTLFLDEIGDMSLMTQSKVLRVLEEGEVQPIGSSDVFKIDARVVAATNKNLEEEVAAGRFREDLFYRLNVATIELPSLAERKSDIPYLVEHFLGFFCEEYNKRRKHLTSRALEALVSQNWTGNVRELRNVVEKLVVFVEDDAIDLVHVRELLGRQMMQESLEFDLPLKDARNRFEREYIVSKLIANDWNMGETAAALSMERTNLYRKIKQLNIKQP
jgi:two-component system nitrogen regulation response regulator NtrX